MQPNVPQSNQKTVRAYMKVKSFVSVENPNKKQMEEYDNELIAFLETIDNAKRFLNGRNSYSLGNKIYTLVWYLESIPDQPVTQPFGGGMQEVKTEPTKDE